MRGIITILFSLFVVLQLDAQTKPVSTDSLRFLVVSFDSSSRRIDSLTRLVQIKTDSARSALDSILNRPTAYADSLSGKIQPLRDKLNTVQSGINDSINSVLSNASNRFSSLTIESKVDSITNNRMTKSLRTAVDSINRVDPLQGTHNSLDQHRTNIRERGNASAAKVNEKLDLLSKQSEGQGVLPENVAAPTLPGVAIEKPGLPQVNLPEADLDIPTNTKLPHLPTPKPVEIVGGKGLDPDLKLPGGSVSEAGGIDMNGVSNKISSASENVSGMSRDIQGVREGNPDAIQSVEGKVVSTLPIGEEMAAIRAEEQLMEKKREEIERLKKRDEYKKQTLVRARKIVTQHLATYEGQLNESMKKVSAYQNKMGTILNKKGDLPKRRDPLRKLKTFEKFVPGLTLQFQNSGTWVADLNPSLRYRLTSYWSAGTGWNQRIIFGKDYRGSYQDRVYGVRSFSEVIIFKGIVARIEVETMNMFIASDVGSKTSGTRTWIWTYAAGVKKEFTFFPRILGNVQFMYTAYSPARHNPYPSKFNVRFGFERSLKKKSRR